MNEGLQQFPLYISAEPISQKFDAGRKKSRAFSITEITIYKQCEEEKGVTHLLYNFHITSS